MTDDKSLQLSNSVTEKYMPCASQTNGERCRGGHAGVYLLAVVNDTVDVIDQAHIEV